jgi:hypothetical protein
MVPTMQRSEMNENKEMERLENGMFKMER